MVWKKILSGDYNESIGPKNEEIKELAQYQNLIRSLLVKERLKRLGYGVNGYEDIRNHPFF
jgi:hypothetical protein